MRWCEVNFRRLNSTEFHQATNRTFDPYMPLVVFGAFFGGIALTVGARHRFPH
jgi:hypothetical protein